jgi:hypothetical protein
VATGPRSLEDTGGPHRRILLPVVILGLHIFSVWAFGATFWYDSANYLQLGFALGSPGDLNAFYSGPNYYIFQHLMPGYPLLFAATVRLFGRYGWPVLTAIQHLVAICALVYFLRSVCRWLSPRWCLITGILICAHPYYMAFHHSPMTESVAGSLLLIAVGAAIRILGGGPVSRHALLVLAASGVLAFQIRALGGLIVLGILTVLLFTVSGWPARLRTAGAAVTVAASLLVFPAYRWAVTGAFFMPNIDYLTLSIALGVNAQPTGDAVRQLKAFPLPSHLSAETLTARGMTYKEAADLGAHLRSLGYRDGAARSIVRRMAWIVRTDSARVIVNQARLALLSIGTAHLALAGGGTREFYRGYSLEEFRGHVRYYLDWFSWTMFESYAPVFDQYLVMFGQTPETIDDRVRQSLDTVLRPFFVARQAIFRDPLKLSRVPFELWIVGGLLAVLSRARQHLAFAVLLATPVVLNYVVSLNSAIGDLRYAQGLLPLYTAGSVVLMADAVAWSKRRIFASRAERTDT